MVPDNQDIGNEVQFKYWDPEDNEFWESKGKKLAFRNLWISTPNLLLGFAIWIIFSVVIVAMQQIHDVNPTFFAFSELGPLTQTEYKALVLLLPAIAGLSGATLRIPNSFMIAISGGRNVIASTTLLLLIPMVLLGIALQDPNVPFITLIVIAVFVGVGGGAFASSMSNISFFFPKRIQGLSLGLNAGLGNVGVSIMQIVIPLIITVSIFGPLSGVGRSVSDGSSKFIPNAALIWIPILVIFMLAAWFKMNNLPQHDVSNTRKALSRYFFLEFLGFIGAGVGTVILVVITSNVLNTISDKAMKGALNIILIFGVCIIAIILTLILLRYLTNQETKGRLLVQFEIFQKKHNWTMTWLYIATFGSFIGFSAVFPKLILDNFGYLPDGAINPNAPNPFLFAFLGPLVGSLIRPIGGWMSDKWGGAKVTQYNFISMILLTFAVGFVLTLTKGSDTPQDVFPIFLILFLLLFITTGIGNGSTFRMVPIIFEREQAGPVLGWISAVAAYGAFIIPAIFSVSLSLNSPELAMYGFAIYYISCLVVNWHYYAKKNAEIPC
ncbi:MAG: Nitrate/nitrite transporter NarK [Candidatus Heimdallarchaeota archaeon LC_3]|nr:MAG: Nitrate/nitrite transporter NarK [Candidatus Heimdallarchaeota archaeon LC_3]